MNTKIAHRMIKYSRNLGIGFIGTAVLGYGLDFQISRCTERIYSQGQLEKIVEKERSKIGISPAKIITSVLEDLEQKMPKIPAYGEKKKNTYSLHFDDTIGNSRGIVRHELCHIYYEDYGKNLTSKKALLHYLCIQEPRAMWCSIDF